ncbi:MAG: glutathione S-transferase family protein [Alphaproteobacteria bacterium]|nr:glutathione S-transferase family protein [Alphaproteobacteria bacterium]
MITLYGSFSAFGLPQASPFVMKTEVQLKMAGLPYRLEPGRPADGPKGKIPYIVEEHHKIGDSTFIRDHIERVHGLDLDRGLTAEMRGRGWAIERMVEDHLYWVIVHDRWMDDANFERGPARFFDALPEAVRDKTRQETRERVRLTLHGQGIGRHARSEITALGRRSVAALAALLGNRAHLLGPEPSAVDATAFAMLASLLTPHFESELRLYAESHGNLVTYCQRMMGEHYPTFARKAA